MLTFTKDHGDGETVIFTTEAEHIDTVVSIITNFLLGVGFQPNNIKQALLSRAEEL